MAADLDSVAQAVSKIMADTVYGQMLDAGLLSSMYPFPLAALTEVGILTEAALLPVP